VPSAPGEGRRRKLTAHSTKMFGEWAETASEEDFDLVAEALMCVVEDTWPDKYRGYIDPTSVARFHLEVRPGLILSLFYVQEYSDYV
jgi:hypothetical protein